jgi:KaiC/GvpD/RAD55 family RecA-like ATPase
MLRYGLHKGSYFIDSQPQYLKYAFMQQIADRAAESGIDVLYISTELSRYDLMVETISRLSYEIHQGDPNTAVSAMSIMTGEEGADLASLKDELNWYRGRISEHLFILDHEAVSEYAASSDAATAGDVLTELISSIVREGAHKPVVFIDNIENILSTEDSEDMKPLMEGLSRLAKELGIPILMSYGYAQAESEEEMYPEEREYHESIGNMCDVYLELEYADMIADDMVPLTSEDIREMVDEGESLLINILLHKNRRPMKASLQIQGTPKFNFFEE